MAITRARIDKQLQLSTNPRSIIITNASNEPSFFSPSTGADTIFFWDDSASNWAQLTVGTNLSISGTTLNASAGAGGYAEVQEEGSALTARTKINFVGAGFTAADDAGNTRTNVTLDATLNALAAYNTNGILTQTAADTFTGRTITGTTDRISIANGDGVSGNPTIDIAAGYVGQASITTLGTIATGTWNATTIAANKGGTGFSSYAVGDILAADTTSTLSKVAAVASGSVLKSAGTNTLPVWGTLASTDLSNSANIAMLNENETVSGTWTFSNNITLNGTPSAGTDVTNVNYVTTAIGNAIAGLRKGSVRAATTAAGTLATSFENGDTIDGVTLATGDLILIKNQAAPAENGVYTVNASGAPTRATWMDAASEIDGVFVLVEDGTANVGTLWMTVSEVTTLGTDAIVFTQIPTTGSGTVDGTGVANKLAVWSDADTLTQFTDLHYASGQLAVGTATPISASIISTQGTGTGDTTFGYSHKNSSGTTVFQVADDGRLQIGSATATSLTKNQFNPGTNYTFNTGANNVSFSVNNPSGSLNFTTSAVTLTTPIVNFSPSYVVSSGTQTVASVAPNFAPTTGTAVLNAFSFAPIVNQTGGANGITRAIHVIPTLTAAADFRGIEISASGQTALQVNSGGVRFDLGSDATGDMYYRAATTGFLTRIPVGSSSQVLIGGTTPSFGSIPYGTTIGYIESSTATTIDLDANVGEVKDRDGSNIAFTLPTNLDLLEVYRNGVRLARTGTSTTRDYSLNAGTNAITFTDALTTDEVVLVIKPS